jgi:chemotaxis protein MotB
LNYLQAKTQYQEQTIADMENKLREWKDAYDKLLEQKVKDNEEFQKQFKTWEMEKRRLSTIRTDRERQLDGSVNELTIRLQAEIDKNAKARKEIESAQSRITANEKDITALKTTQNKTDKDLASARSELETLRGQLQAADKARQTAELRAKTADGELKQLKATSDERGQKINELEQTVAQLQSNLKAASDGKTTMSALVADLRKQLAEEKRIGDAERQKHKSELARLTKELASLRGGAKGEEPALSKAKDELAQAMAEEIKQKSAEVIVSYDRVTVRIRCEALFEPSTLVFLKSAQARLRQIADILAQYPGYQLRVEGHTDNQPVRDMPFPDNLALSSQRANNVLRFLQEAAKLPQKQTRATGCADSEPVASNDTPEGRQRNRRVEIILGREE